MKRLAVVLCLCLAFSLTMQDVWAKKDKMVVAEGKEVAFDYTLTVNNEVVDSSKNSEPLKYTHGKGEIIPGLSKGLEGMQVGDEKTIEVPPEEAYGQINQQAFREIPKTSLPKEIDTKVGIYLQMKTPTGQVFPAKIVKVDGESVTLDLNHPLAGKTLVFNVKIVSIK